MDLVELCDVFLHLGCLSIFNSTISSSPLDPFETKSSLQTNGFTQLRQAARWHVEGMVVMVVEGRRRWHWDVSVMQGMKVVHHVDQMYLVPVRLKRVSVDVGFHVEFPQSDLHFWFTC